MSRHRLDKNITMKVSEIFSPSNLCSLAVALLAVGIAYGATNQRLESLEKRQDILENRQTVLLEQIRSDVGALRVDLAKVSQDIEWLKDQKNPEK